MQDELLIRRATVEDIDAALEMWRVSAVPTPTDSEDNLRALVQHPMSVLLLAERGGELVGTVIAAWDGWRGNVYRLAVVPGERRRGAAGALTSAADAHLLSAGATRISALVARDDTRARAFWNSRAAAGYEHDESSTRYVKTGR